MLGQTDSEIAEIIARGIANALEGTGLDYEQKGKTILEPGCGQGFMIEALEKQFPQSRVYGFDRNKFYVRTAKQLGRKVVNGDMNRMPIADRSVDLIVTSNIFDYSGKGEPIQMEQTIPEILRVLKPGGVYVSIADKEHIERAIVWWPEAFTGFEHRYKNAIHILVKR